MNGEDKVRISKMCPLKDCYRVFTKQVIVSDSSHIANLDEESALILRTYHEVKEATANCNHINKLRKETGI